eukprot:CAMPEP_0195286264 /NCGR_PEP_ID=MMETSP0707-20130614/3788_1 /TAXON_ID=33640 /ORGANISM="Asterionellopsis glacialis, Strain CCMP134" /LENGTH=144 /DNA_ID=CAMNT_0040345879 /DNA_START=137 /DNA_END=571 /DNA_ORIENTATION=-
MRRSSSIRFGGRPSIATTNNNVVNNMPTTTRCSFASLQDGDLTNIKMLSDYVQEQQPDTDVHNNKVKKLNKEQIAAVLKTCFQKISEDLKNGNTVRIPDFGKFEPAISKARKGRIPKTQEPIEIPQSKRVKFTSSIVLKRKLNE